LAGLNGDQLFTLKFPATLRPVGIDRAFAVAGIKSGAWLRHPQAVLLEQSGVIAALRSHVGKQNTIAA